MNYIFLSPHFPVNYYNFIPRLREFGVNVFGIADENFENLRYELKYSLNEYYKVNDLHNYDELLRAVAFFTFKYGKIDRLESFNEYWLETDARLRTDFNIPGIKLDQIEFYKNKSRMKELFQKARINVAKGKVVKEKTEAEIFIKEVGYPIVAKPDKGVGAAQTYKIENDDELNSFFNSKPPIDYILEEFIEGDIYSFDGLTDQNGEIVFFTSHKYQRGIMETVNNDLHIYYYSLIDIPQDLYESGKRIVETFEVKERFFHFEFFRRYRDGKLYALEVNMRPPGGFTLDMFNYACDFDVYREYASIVVTNKLTAEYERKYHVCYIGRKFNKNYVHTHEEILKKFNEILVMYSPISPVLSDALGNYCYIVRSKDFSQIEEAIEFIHKMWD
ncbi:MAG: ATP-grasp domain-containing protein [Ignavibacteria bacterium]|jgi:biotin carboxylase|nr:ATP-grasp domain-containing protein [Ignavibacteria bacterium]MDH7528114.1 ATP-grasp domain-containing protein [Ignavibacteria bacterium]